MDSVLLGLAGVLGNDRVEVDGARVATVSRDESDLPPARPLAVVRPRHTQDVVAVVRACHDARLPLTARGGGTSLEGSSVPSVGAIVLDLSDLARVAQTSVEERLAVVEAGVVFDRLNERLRPTGLFFPPTPGGSADAATIGGMVATDAGGLYAVRYGGTRRWVRGLTVVTGDGTILHTGSRLPKTSTGVDLTQVFVGAEGTLGIVTEVTLGLCPVPEARQRAAWAFDDLGTACACVADLLLGIPDLAAVEVVDRGTVDLLRAGADGAGAPAGDLLLIEVHGRASECAAAIQAACDIASTFGARPVDGATDPWELRHRLTRAVRESAAPSGVVRTDAAVPLPRLAAFVAATQERAAARGRRLHVFGHAGLGILHFLAPLAGAGAWPLDEARDWKVALCVEATRQGGVVSGEHGVGLGNREAYLATAGATLPYLRALKSVFDPAGILNPGKIL
jgi:D-lactate dehydrogenase (cytochrome)